MNKKEEFKNFVKQHPELAKHVNDGSMSWQKFYEMYDMYGEDNDAWKSYITAATVANTAALAAGAFGIAEILKWLKTINLTQIQTGVNSMQRILGLVQEMNLKNENKEKEEEYKPRPQYKHFED